MPKNPFEITEEEALAATAERIRRPPVEPKDIPVDLALPENSGPYSHGRYGVLESDNQDKPYIERRSDPFGIDAELLAQEAMEAAERRR